VCSCPKTHPGKLFVKIQSVG